MGKKSKDLINVTKQLRDECNKLINNLICNSSQIEFVYNPLDYAWKTHHEYIQKYGGLGAKTILVGMNPGHGMGNTGIPFGCPEKVKTYLEIKDLEVNKPEIMHPKRIIQGLLCKKVEISGKRIWGLIEDIYGPPKIAFKNIFVINHFPLWMFNNSGQNITPEKLQVRQAKRLFDLCDKYLINIAKILELETIIGVGKYAHRMTKNAIHKAEMNHIKLKLIPHPSPANPIANKKKGSIWKKIATEIIKS